MSDLTRRLQAPALCLLLLGAGCGEDKKAPVVEPDLDAGPTDAAMDTGAGGQEFPRMEYPDTGPPPVPDSGLPPTPCNPVECNLMADLGCQTAACDPETNSCVFTNLDDGIPCGSDENGACTAPDLCVAGSCEPNHVAEGTVCGARRSCHEDDTCDGMGTCVDNGFSDEGSACGDQTETECDKADSCDGAGACKKRYAAEGDPCGSDKHPDCGGVSNPDACSGDGLCISGGVLKPNDDPNGIPPGDEQPFADYCRTFLYERDPPGCAPLDNLNCRLVNGGAISNPDDPDYMQACRCGNIKVSEGHPCPDRCDNTTGSCVETDACIP